MSWGTVALLVFVWLGLTVVFTVSLLRWFRYLRWKGRMQVYVEQEFRDRSERDVGPSVLPDDRGPAA